MFVWYSIFRIFVWLFYSSLWRFFMDMMDKLNILADSAKYDVSCSSSGSKRVNKNGIGNGKASGICHSWASDASAPPPCR